MRRGVCAPRQRNLAMPSTRLCLLCSLSVVLCPSIVAVSGCLVALLDFFSIGRCVEKKYKNMPPNAMGCPAVIVQFVLLMCNCSIVCRFGYDAIDAIMTQFNLAYKMPLLPFVRLVLLVVYQLILLSLLLLFLLKRHLMSDSRCW